MLLVLVEPSTSKTPNARLASSDALLSGEGIAPEDDVLRLTAFTWRQLRADSVVPWRRRTGAHQRQVVLVPLVRLGRGPVGAAVFLLQLLVGGFFWRRRLRGGVVYVLNPHNAALAYLFARLLRAPLVCRLQSDLPRGRASFVVRSVLTWALRRSTGVIAISEFTWGVATGAGVHPSRIRLRPPALDRAFLGAGPPDRRTARFTVGFVGRLEKQKGPIDAVRAFAAAPSEDWTLVIAGRGSQQAAVVREVNRLGLGDRTEWLGYVDRSRLPDVLAGIHTVLVPTCVEEGLGRVAVEALLCGAAVVGYETGGLREACGGGGLLVPKGDTTGLAEALARLAGDPNLRNAVVSAGRAHADGVVLAARTEVGGLIGELAFNSPELSRGVATIGG